MATLHPSFDDDPPLSIEPVVGWRVWRLRRRAGVLTLVSVMRTDVWPGGEVMEATCMVHPSASTPDPLCGCGLYAASTPEDLARSSVFGSETCVIGAIGMWGRIVEHARGARSRFAYPARLHLVCGPCLNEGSGAIEPVQVATAGSTMNAFCARHLPTQLGPFTPADEVQAELLSTYGVDIVPIERLRRSTRGGVITSPRSPEARVLWRVAVVVGTVLRLLLGGLFMLWACSGIIFIVGSIAFSIVGAGMGLLGFGTNDPAPTPVVAAPPLPQPFIVPPTDDLPERGTRPPPPPAFAIVCGLNEGEWVQIVPCDLSSDLMGFTERAAPSGAATDCAPGWDAYSNGPHYWVCWIDLRSDTRVRPWARAPNPWSVPVARGGAVHGYR